jgi:serine/threonine protein phosphatase PrpC
MTTPDDPARCPACGAASIPGARYCEACGHELAEPTSAERSSAEAGPVSDVGGTVPESAAGTAEPIDAGEAATPPAYGTSSAPPPGCASCHHPEVNPDGYCDSCGARRPAAASHSVVDLGRVAGVSDIGSRHHHNEDAMGLAAFGQVAAAVVCDGVSSSTRPDTASIAAAIAATNVVVAALPALVARIEAVDGNRAATDTDAHLDAQASPSADNGTPAEDTADASGIDAGGAADHAGLLATTDDVGTREVTHGGAAALLHDATAAAQAAAASVIGANASPNPPSTTLVAAVVTAADITVGWVGDSRAYWLPDAGTPGGPSCLTVDDTLAGQLGAAGVAMAADARSAGALIRWLGADATDTEPHISTLVPSGPGRVIVCSDGLYRYVPQPGQLADVTPTGPPIEVASALVRFALEAGGQDNVTVAVLPYPPEVEVRTHPDEPARHNRPDRDDAEQSPH